MATIRDKAITMAHGGGGRAMRELIERLIVPAFENPLLTPLEDQAQISLKGLAECGDRLAFTTDSYVVSPLFFPGGDIGKLAICGTVNDLAMSGAVPLFLSCGLIIEEGLATTELERVLASMSALAKQCGVQVVTGDTKVVNRGAADRLFINTAGIGMVAAGVNISATRARPGDVIIVNGTLGDHGVAILVSRNELDLHSDIPSDCQPLHGLVQAMLKACPDIHCLRDATRGGLATVLNEFAISSKVGMRLQERALPLKPEVRGACEMLGLDVLYMANEGKLVAVVPREAADAVLAAMRAHPAGVDSAVVGEVLTEPAGHVILNTLFGGERVVDMLVGEQLPRIC
jgi:hydrogenase expression/formation protein HypE